MTTQRSKGKVEIKKKPKSNKAIKAKEVKSKVKENKV
jgi:hypothetical protein